MRRPPERFLIFLLILIIPIILEFIPKGEIFPHMRGLSMEIPVLKGTGKAEFAEHLFANGLFFDESLLRTYVISMQGLRYGSYIYYSDLPTHRFMKDVAEGREFIKQRRITIIEGADLLDIAENLESKRIVSSSELMEYAKSILTDSAMREKYLISDAALDLEGYLFPDTYYFKIGSGPKEVLHKFLFRFRQVVLELIPTADRDHIYEGLIKASLVEKETGVGEESLIASVIDNRLKLDMRLQIDATILYALRKDGYETNNITRKNKYYKSPFNTYRVKGLPPGPICSPGRKSLEAVFLPEKTPYLYYVSKNDGTHDFSVNYKEHQRKVDKYQR